MNNKITTARININGERFEILVYPDNALNYKMGRNVELSQVIASDEVFSDSSKGQRANEEKLKKGFRTLNNLEISETILKKGDLQLTSEQRKNLIDDKRKQILNAISKNYVDPKTLIPHPPVRIEQAMKEARLSIDPFKSTSEQITPIIDQIRTILPLKSEKLNLTIKIAPQYASQAIGVMKNFGDLETQDWNSDGSLTAQINIPAGLNSDMMNKLGSITKGTAQATIRGK